MSDITENGKRKQLPWERRREIGLFKAFWQTVRLVLFKPEQFFSLLVIRDTIIEPLLFSLMVNFHISIISFAVGYLSKKELQAAGPIKIFLALILIFMMGVIMLFVVTGVMHLLVRLFGGKGGLKGTFNIMAYSCAASLFTFIPVIGRTVGGLWGMMIIMGGYISIHKFSAARAILVLFLPILLGIIIAACFIFLL